MSDNVIITAGSGTTIAADEVVDGSLGTVKVQYVKIMDGTPDGTSKAAVGANGMSVDVKASVLPTGAALDATLTGGTQKSITRGGAKGTTTAADVTSTASGANRQLLDVAIYDSTGTQIESFSAGGGGGSGTEYTEDAAAANNPTGPALILVRQDTLSGSTVSADGDNIAARATSKGEIYVKQTDAVPVTDNGGSLTVDNGGTFAVQAAQSGTWNINSITTLPSLPAGTNAFGKLAANSGVDIGDVDVTTCGTITPGTAAANLGKAEDASHSSGDTGVFIMGVRNDTPSSMTSANGDYAGVTTNAYNQLHVTPCAVATVSVTPTVSTTPAYTAGDAVGGKMTFSNATRIAAYSGRIKSVIVVDQAKQAPILDLVIFNADPSSTTVTDNSVLDVADGDMSKIVARVPLVDWVQFNDNAACAVNNLSLDFNLASGSSLYGALVTRGTPTFAATNDVIVTLVIEQD